MTLVALMTVLGAISKGLRAALLVLAVLTAIVAIAAWAARTRRISPFGGLSRAIRRATDPLFVPLERRLVRRGIPTASAPWWLLGVVVVGGLLLIALFDFLTGQILSVMTATSAGPRGVLVLLIEWTFAILRLALLVRVLASWIAISPLNPVIRASYRLTEWFLHPMRSIIPTMGMIDITPLIAWFLLGIVEKLVVSALV